MILSSPIEFQWDKGNIDKNLKGHDVANEEIEEVFFGHRIKVVKDMFHSGKEERYLLIGKTLFDRVLFIVFTLRNNKVRVISASDLNKKEEGLYL
ncbi:MAG: BrnT family toxin [Patescibacteria group bacterium]|nr:BrnT family toxin [Patescibacteria group bacterium]MBU1953270.1 BrnT family toxin [Patescibacteria group bacterium]